MPDLFKIGYDARMIHHSGIGVRIQHLLKYLLRNNQNRFKFYLFGSKEKLKEFENIENVEIVEYRRPIYSLGEFFGHPKMREMHILDIPHFNSPWKCLRKTIVTVHDLTPYILKKYFPSPAKRFYLNIVFQMLKKSGRIVGVSQHTLDDLKREFNFPEKKLQLIYNGLDREVFYKREEKEILKFKKNNDLPNEYLLAVGIGKEHKNLKFVIESLKSSWLDGVFNIPLVIAGVGGKFPDYIKEVVKGVEKFVIPMKFIDYNDLPLLYQGAIVLVYPSLYEGFGFPLIEAQAQEVPVFSSNVSVMPEILGDSAVYFDPYKKDQNFISKLKSIIEDESLRNDLIEKGKKNIERFYWENAAKQTIELYLSIKEELNSSH
ncbi:MAG: glycosyltransferase family 4 protein [Leptospiraceae bacterium]|nr:glycosyltransferase family 4 protein [Leptospiraceae bacterium]